METVRNQAVAANLSGKGGWGLWGDGSLSSERGTWHKEGLAFWFRGAG